MSLFTRSYITLTVILFLAFFITLIVVDSNLENEDGKIFAAVAGAEILYVERWLEGRPATTWPEIIGQYQSRFDTQVSVRTKQSLAHRLKKEYLDGAAPGVHLNVEPWEDWWYIQPLAHTDYYIVVEEGDELPATDDWFELFVPLATLFLVLGLGFYLLARRTRNYLSELATTTTAIGEGQWQRRANVDVPEPIRSLARSVNAMAVQLKRTFEDQQIALGAIPHEIRSPISRLRFAAQMAQDAAVSPESSRAVVRIERALTHLENTVESTLQLVRDPTTDLAEKESVSASVLLDKAQGHYEGYSGVPELRWQISNDAEVHGHAQLLLQAIVNVVDNAIRYGKEQVHVNISTQLQHSCIIIDDDGPGIAQEHREDVLSPFYRLDPSRTRDTGGVGLGLAIASNILKRHGGEISVLDSPLGGARFTLRW